MMDKAVLRMTEQRLVPIEPAEESKLRLAQGRPARLD